MLVHIFTQRELGCPFENAYRRATFRMQPVPKIVCTSDEFEQSLANPHR